MYQVRLAAALLTGFTVLVVLLFNADPGVGIDVLACCTFAALSLVPFVPSKPSSSVSRNRIIAACAVYSCAVSLALVCAILAYAPPAVLSALSTLLIAGVALTAWSRKACRTRSRSAWANYFDN